MKVPKTAEGDSSSIRNDVKGLISKLQLDKLSSDYHIIPDRESESKQDKKGVSRFNRNEGNAKNQKHKGTAPDGGSGLKEDKVRTPHLNKEKGCAKNQKHKGSTPGGGSGSKEDKRRTPRSSEDGGRARSRKTHKNRPPVEAKVKTNERNGQQKQGSHLVIKSGKWDPDEFLHDPTEFEAVTKEKEKKLVEEAKKLYERDVETYKTGLMNKKGQNYDWLKTVSSKGTSGDRMAAFVVYVQESPVHNVAYVESLVSLLHKEKRSKDALNTMKDLFLQDLLLKNRKLKEFNEHPLSRLDELSSGNKDGRNKRLILWYFESLLKQAYSNFIRALEVLSRDNIEALRNRTTAIVWELLCENPEQEKVLLSILVNKLGDPSPKVASHSVNLLNKLLQRHKKMTSVVTLETEKLLCRSNVPRRAQFYGICLLSGLQLQEGDSDLAVKLIDIFFGLFREYIAKGDIETKMLSAILTGVNKVFPHAKVQREKVMGQVEALYKLCHMTKFNTSVQALALLHQVVDANDGACDRFYILLYKKLLDPEMSTSSKLPLFLNILCKSMKKDFTERRVQAFIKRVLQLCHIMPPPFVCSALCLISEVAKERPHLLRFESTTEDDESEDEHYTDVKDEDDDKLKEDDDDDDAQTEIPHINTAKSSWIHRNLTNCRLSHYDPTHRNPLFCRADLECTWELKVLADHFHPTVSLFAKTLLKGEVVKYSGDPMMDFTFKRFLERFVARNPKKAEDDKDSEDKSSRKTKEEEDGSVVDDDEDIREDIDKDFDFGSDFGDVFGDEDDFEDEDLLGSDDEIDEATDDEEANAKALGIQPDKAQKQLDWEDGRRKSSSSRKRKMGKSSSKAGPRSKKQKR